MTPRRRCQSHSAGATDIFLFHYYLSYTHRRTIQIKYVDLYDAFLMAFLIKTLLSNGIRTPRYAFKRARGFVLPTVRQ